MRSTVLAKSRLWASKLTKSSHWPQILSKKRKQCAFHENCTKPFFRVMRSTFWPNRIFNCQSSQNRETRHKVSSKRKSSALSMKIGQNALFRSCATRFGQIAFLSVKVVKIVTLARNSLQNLKFQKGKIVRFWKQCAFHENCTKRSFQVMRRRFCPNRIFEGQTSQNRHTGREFSPKRENSALLMKIVRNALFRSCAAYFGQIAFLSVKFVTLAWNSLQNEKTVRFPWKL